MAVPNKKTRICIWEQDKLLFCWNVYEFDVLLEGIQQSRNIIIPENDVT